MRITTVGILLFSVTVLFADVPNEIAYQGRLREYGQPVTGTRTMNFRIYHAATGPGIAWESGNVDVTVSSGTFSYLLTPTNIDWRQKDYWIETTVSGKVLAPRDKITTQAYALHSATAEDISKPVGNGICFSIGSERKATLSSAGEFSALVGGTTFYLVPKGAIIMWSGTIASIPNGWALCDGTAGTPDLRDRFILSVSGNTENPGTFGGSLAHYHSIDEHTHNLSNHSHSYNGTTTHAHGSAYETGDDYQYNTDGSKTSHKHDFSGVSGGPSSNTTSSTSLASNNTDHLPPYFKLAFIIKL